MVEKPNSLEVTIIMVNRDNVKIEHTINQKRLVSEMDQLIDTEEILKDLK